MLGLFLNLVLAAALALLIYAAVYHGLWALTGFGIPLDAVVWPKLVLGDDKPNPADNERRLSRRSLLVAPHRILRETLARREEAGVVDLAHELLGRTDKEVGPEVKIGELIDFPKDANGARKSLLLVSGLELTLRDAPRRRAALAFLEKAEAALNESGKDGLSCLVVMTEMSPLERILDAFENFEKDDKSRSTMREELRWARLFEDFTTFSFAPVDKVIQEDLDSGASRLCGRPAAGISALVPPRGPWCRLRGPGRGSRGSEGGHREQTAESPGMASGDAEPIAREASLP